jgi:pilus assembly protein CpaF
MLAAMNTGHNGSMSTIHANSSQDALRRVESLVLQHAANWSREVVRDHVASAVNAIVHVARHLNGSRMVKEILFLDENKAVTVVEDGRITSEPLL